MGFSDNLTIRDDRKLTHEFKSTPIKIGKTLYISTSLGHVAAISADEGKTIWTFDTKTYADGRPTNLGFNLSGKSRAYWRDNKQETIIMPTNIGYLWAIDLQKPASLLSNLDAMVALILHKGSADLSTESFIL